jgi:hypothetical protein
MHFPLQEHGIGTWVAITTESKNTRIVPDIEVLVLLEANTMSSIW